jgi:hypothetical protein
VAHDAAPVTARFQASDRLLPEAGLAFDRLAEGGTLTPTVLAIMTRKPGN